MGRGSYCFGWLGIAAVIREAKGVAIHDLSFWAGALPLLDRLPRVIKRYEATMGAKFPMSLTPETGLELHEETLERFLRLANGEEVRQDISDHLALSLLRLLRSKSPMGTPAIRIPVRGCGVVIGGTCDLVWQPILVELKLTAKPVGLRDVRQVLTYAGLMQLSGQETPKVCIVANPRRGAAVEFELAELLMVTGGLTIDEFAFKLGDFLVSAGQSN